MQEASKSSVVKRMFSIPIPLFKFAEKQAAKEALEGKPPNLSAYVSRLIGEDKARAK